MSKRARARNSGPDARKRAAQSPFAALKGTIRQQSPAAPAKVAIDQGSATATSVSDDDAALFRREMRDARRLRDDNRHALERPKPPPQPRPSAPEDVEPAPTGGRRPFAPRTDAELLSAAMQGVQRLADDNRVDLLPRSRYREDQSGKRAPGTAAPPDAASTNEDLLDWAHAGATPLKGDGRIDIARPRPAPLPLQSTRDEQSVLRESIEAPLSLEDRLEGGDEAVFLRNGLPRRVLGDLRRGRWVVQGELDLHGLTRDEARMALAEFLGRCLRESRRCVRLIHGKGLGSPGGVGVLKQLSRGWLPQREEILAYCQALPHQGGSGALLILLRAGGTRQPARRREPAA